MLGGVLKVVMIMHCGIQGGLFRCWGIGPRIHGRNQGRGGPQSEDT